MEEHLNDKDKLQKEWEELCNPVPESPQTQLEAVDLKNALKNRYMNLIPCKLSTIIVTENVECDWWQQMSNPMATNVECHGNKCWMSK